MKAALLIVGLLAVNGIIAHSDASDEDDRYRPLLRLLKNLQRRNRPQQSNSNTNSDAQLITAVSSTTTVSPLDLRIVNSNKQTDLNSLPPLGGSSSGSTFQGSGSSNGGGFQPLPPLNSDTKVTPQRIDQINKGVSTILGGVGRLSLEEILRGSFMFTRNENVKTVANNVLDSIFGNRRVQ